MKKSNLNYLIEALEFYAPHLVDKIDFEEALSKNIQQLDKSREILQMTVEEFAKSLGISKTRYYFIIKGNCNFKILKKYVDIAKKLQKEHIKNKSK